MSWKERRVEFIEKSEGSERASISQSILLPSLLRFLATEFAGKFEYCTYAATDGYILTMEQLYIYCKFPTGLRGDRVVAFQPFEAVAIRKKRLGVYSAVRNYKTYIFEMDCTLQYDVFIRA